MSTNEVRFRQIHLDFHTSPLIDGVGDEFDPEEFAQTLENARVNSINLFSRCHHGMLYYPSKKFPERVHPHLSYPDLLTQQVEACHRHDIHVNLYSTVRWDIFTVNEHPEWIAIDENGRYSNLEVKNFFFEPGFYTNLCWNTAYRQFLKDQIGETLELIPFEGVWFDAAFVVECCCKTCLAGMATLGLDPRKPEDRKHYCHLVYYDFVRDMSSFVRQFNPDFSIFYNKGHVGILEKPVLDGYTYFAFESLHGGPWGYMDFPLSVRYARTLGKECVGMTGRFHTSWGDFHSFRNRAQLEYECYGMLAQGALCNIGDQLEPSGRLSAPMYDLIGSVYSEVEKKEPWCRDARPLADIGVFTPEEFPVASASVMPGLNLPAASQGVCRMLQESGHQFNFIDSEADFTSYKVLVLPDVIPVSARFAEKLEVYLDSGGSLIATGESGLNQEKSAFGLSSLGVVYKGPAPYNPDFILPKGQIGTGLPEAEHVMYLRGAWVESVEGSKVLANAIEPLFNRTYEHFTSHAHAPSSGKVGYPAIVKNGRAIYFTHPIFTTYQRNAPRWCKTLFLNALEMLLPEPILIHNGPSTLLATVNQQADEKRWIVHLLHYIPERRSAAMDTIEEAIPLYDIKISLFTGKPIHSVECVPQHEPLNFEDRDGRTEFVVPLVNGHQMVAVQFNE